MSQKRTGILLSYINVIMKNLIIILYTPVLLRFLGQSEYGLYQMANSIISSLSLLNLGFSSAYVRFYSLEKARDDDQAIKRLNGMYMTLFVTIGVIALIIGTIFILNLNLFFGNTLTNAEQYTTKILMSLMILNVSLSFPSSVFDCNIMVNEQFRYLQSRQLFQTIVVPILTLPLLFMGVKSIAVVSVQTAIAILFIIINANFAIRRLHMEFDFKHYDFQLLKQVGIFSSFLFLNQIVDQINWNLPNFLLGVLSGPNDVAIYAVANQIKNVIMTLSTSLSGVFIPQINKIVSERNNNSELTKLMTKVGRLQMTVLGLVFGGFIVVGNYFVLAWAGSSYHLSYPIALVLILPLIMPLIQNTGIEIQRAKNMHKFRSIIYTVFALLNGVISFLLIQSFGVIASPIGTLFTMIIANGILMNWYYQSKVKLNMKLFWSSIVKLLPQLVIPVIILMICQNFYAVNSFISFVIYGVAYVALYMIIYLLFGVNNEEKQILKSIIKPFKR